MESSPKPSKNINTTVSPSPDPVEESPVFTYISNLSPITNVQLAVQPQCSPGFNFPHHSASHKRHPSGRISGVGFSAKDANSKEAVIVADESRISNALSSSGLTPCPQSLSASAADLLTNVVRKDGRAFTSSTNLTPQNSDDIPQPVNSQVDSTESEVKMEDKDDKGKSEMVTGTSSLISEQDEEKHQVKPSSPVEADEKEGTGDAPSEPCPSFEPNTLIDSSLNNQDGRYSKTQNAGAGKEAGHDCPSQLGSLWNVEDQGNCCVHTEALYTEAGKNEMQHDQNLQVGLQHRGVRRRCLQFEDAQRKTIEKSTCAHSLSRTPGFPSSPASPEVLEVLESSPLDKPAIASSRLLVNANQPTFSSQHSGNYMKVPKPSGIGLHLNSIVNAMQMGSGATVSLQSAQRGSLSVLGKKSSSTMSYHSSKNCSISLNQAEGISVSNEENRHGIVASIATSSATSLSPYRVKHFNDSLVLEPVEVQSNPGDKRKSISENADSDDFSPSSPKKKRKKTLDTGETNGCKRCNCKKTKCLKLYCDCFAAGIYCAEPCACQGCLNRPEYEDTVLETRQQIESRNPLAFAPKIIQRIAEPPTSSSGDDGTRFTPASARHKRGCNCKKSKCLKKYCECYQSNVGCSDGCRCEGCENMYGRKGEYSMIKDLVSKHENDEILDGSFDKKLELAAPRVSLLQNELCNPHNLTPLTPSFQCSNHGKVASKSWFSSGRDFPSPESGVNFLAPYEMSAGPAMNPDNHHMIPGTNNEIMDLVSFDQELEYECGETTNQFEPEFHGHKHSSYLPALLNPQNSANMLRPQMFPGNRHVPPASSLRWRTSPMSQMTHFGGNKLLEVGDYDGRLYGLLDDDTPEILKETPTLLNAVKVSSPNKKRVSPPHGHESGAIGSSSSAGLRSGRKFILQAVPSFPPLTPCIDSKLHPGQNINDSQDCSRK